MAQGRILIVQTQASEGGGGDANTVVLGNAGFVVAEHRGCTGLTRATVAAAPTLMVVELEAPGLADSMAMRAVKEAAMTAGVPMVLFSSLPEEELRALVARVGAVGTIRKTGSSFDLVREVRTWLHKTSPNASAVRAPTFATKRILLVGELPVGVGSGDGPLARASLNVHRVASAAAALQSMREGGADLVVLSALLPDIPAAKLCRTIRATRSFRKASIIAVVSNEGGSSSAELKEAGVSVVLELPLRANELNHQIARFTGIAARAQIRVMVRVGATSTRNAKNTVNTMYLGWSRDVSLSGMLIEIERPIEPSSLVQVRFSLPSSSREIQSRARIVRVRKDAAKFLVALQFSGLPSAARIAIGNLVDSRSG